MMAHYMSPLVLPPRSETLVAINPTPNTFFNQINEVLSGGQPSSDEPNAPGVAPSTYGMVMPNGAGLYSPFKTPAMPLESNPFDTSFGAGGIPPNPSTTSRNSASNTNGTSTTTTTTTSDRPVMQHYLPVAAAPRTLSGDLTTDALDGIQQLMGAAAAAEAPRIAAGRIVGRSDSMSLLTAASELELANQQQRQRQQRQLQQRAMSDKLLQAALSPSNTDSFSSDLDMAPIPVVTLQQQHRQVPKTASTARAKKPAAAKAAKASHAPKQTRKNAAASNGSAAAAAAKAAASSAAAMNRAVKRTFSDDDDDDGMSSDSKREKFLERNRIAAQKCRKRRKERLDELQATTTDIQKSNEALIKEISFLKDENYYVRTLLMEHRDCTVLQDTGLGQLLDSVTRPSIPSAIASAQLAPIISRTSSFS